MEEKMGSRLNEGSHWKHQNEGMFHSLILARYEFGLVRMPQEDKISTLFELEL